MVVNGKALLELAPIKDMLDHKAKANGLSYGLDEDGYDIRVKEDIIFTPKEHNGRFRLGSTVEYFQIPEELNATLFTKSTMARESVVVTTTCLKPGFNGYLTLEFHYSLDDAFTIPSGTPVGHVEFKRVEEPATYKGLYQDQDTGPQNSRSYSTDAPREELVWDVSYESWDDEMSLDDAMSEKSEEALEETLNVKNPIFDYLDSFMSIEDNNKPERDKLYSKLLNLLRTVFTGADPHGEELLTKLDLPNFILDIIKGTLSGYDLEKAELCFPLKFINQFLVDRPTDKIKLTHILSIANLAHIADDRLNPSDFDKAAVTTPYLYIRDLWFSVYNHIDKWSTYMIEEGRVFPERETPHYTEDSTTEPHLTIYDSMMELLDGKVIEDDHTDASYLLSLVSDVISDPSSFIDFDIDNSVNSEEIANTLKTLLPGGTLQGMKGKDFFRDPFLDELLLKHPNRLTKICYLLTTIKFTALLNEMSLTLYVCSGVTRESIWDTWSGFVDEVTKEIASVGSDNPLLDSVTDTLATDTTTVRKSLDRKVVINSLEKSFINLPLIAQMALSAGKVIKHNRLNDIYEEVVDRVILDYNRSEEGSAVYDLLNGFPCDSYLNVLKALIVLAIDEKFEDA